MDRDVRQRYAQWCRQAVADAQVAAELRAMADDERQIEDAFWCDLQFGTGGLRGVIGAGTNRMNVYTVAKASQGLANYLKRRVASPSVVIGYDSRINSDRFAQVAAGVFAANGVTVHIWPELMPVPTVSFATRHLGASAGVMITASHNPSQYNGYKVYGADGCQITTEAAAAILAEIDALDVFADVQNEPFDTALAAGRIRWIADVVYDAYIREVTAQSVLFGDAIDKEISIVYTPLHGAGLRPVTRALREMGYTRVTVVREQEAPDGRFPTCPYPNPEIRETLDCGIACAKAQGADLLLATDPDCDRVGVAVKNAAGDYTLLTGNEVGVLLLDYICHQRRTHGQMPTDPVLVKTIVTTDMATRVAAHYGLRTVNVLTGFKFIGEQIGQLEQAGHAAQYVFGFEESYGYLTGTYVRDKDGVNGVCMVCEMFSYYATRGITLTDKLAQLYQTYGYCLNTLHSYEFAGRAGMENMQTIMRRLRAGVTSFGGQTVTACVDYAAGVQGLPAADVLQFRLQGDSSVVIRPSGTEPKLKMYLSVCAADAATAASREAEIRRAAEAVWADFSHA